MKEKERREYSANYQTRIKLFERKYTTPIYETIKSQYEKILEVVKRDGFQKALTELNYYLVDTDLHQILSDLYQDVGLFLMKRYAREIKQSLRGLKSSSNDLTLKDGRMGIDQSWIDQIRAYFQANLLSTATLPITQTNREEISRLLNEGIQNGWGYQQIADEVRSLPRFRALRIVRTEVAHAANMARILSVQNSDFELSKEWISAHDLRTRTLHRLVDGVVIDEDQLFQVGADRMTGPGDPTASGQNVINCRCTCAFIPKRNAQGRLIPRN